MSRVGDLIRRIRKPKPSAPKPAPKLYTPAPTQSIAPKPAPNMSTPGGGSSYSAPTSSGGGSSSRSGGGSSYTPAPTQSIAPKPAPTQSLVQTQSTARKTTAVQTKTRALPSPKINLAQQQRLAQQQKRRDAYITQQRLAQQRLARKEQAPTQSLVQTQSMARKEQVQTKAPTKAYEGGMSLATGGNIFIPSVEKKEKKSIVEGTRFAAKEQLKKVASPNKEAVSEIRQLEKDIKSYSRQYKKTSGQDIPEFEYKNRIDGKFDANKLSDAKLKQYNKLIEEANKYAKQLDSTQKKYEKKVDDTSTTFKFANYYERKVEATKLTSPLGYVAETAKTAIGGIASGVGTMYGDIAKATGKISKTPFQAGGQLVKGKITGKEFVSGFKKSEPEVVLDLTSGIARLTTKEDKLKQGSLVFVQPAEVEKVSKAVYTGGAYLVPVVGAGLYASEVGESLSQVGYSPKRFIKEKPVEAAMIGVVALTGGIIKGRQVVRKVTTPSILRTSSGAAVQTPLGKFLGRKPIAEVKYTKEIPKVKSQEPVFLLDKKPTTSRTLREDTTLVVDGTEVVVKKGSKLNLFENIVGEAREVKAGVTTRISTPKPSKARRFLDTKIKLDRTGIKVIKPGIKFEGLSTQSKLGKAQKESVLKYLEKKGLGREQGESLFIQQRPIIAEAKFKGDVLSVSGAQDYSILGGKVRQQYIKTKVDKLMSKGATGEVSKIQAYGEPYVKVTTAKEVGKTFPKDYIALETKFVPKRLAKGDKTDLMFQRIQALEEKRFIANGREFSKLSTGRQENVLDILSTTKKAGTREIGGYNVEVLKDVSIAKSQSRGASLFERFPASQKEVSKATILIKGEKVERNVLQSFARDEAKSLAGRKKLLESTNKQVTKEKLLLKEQSQLLGSVRLQPVSKEVVTKSLLQVAAKEQKLTKAIEFKPQVTKQTSSKSLLLLEERQPQVVSTRLEPKTLQQVTMQSRQLKQESIKPQQYLFKSKTKTKQKQVQLKESKQATKQESKQVFKQASKQVSKQSFRDLLKDTYQREIVRVRAPTIKPKAPKIKLTTQKPKVEKQVKGNGDFKIFVKQKGVDVEIDKVKTSEEAKALLFKQLSENISASGFVSKGGRKISLNLQKGFTRSKVDKFRVVEQKQQRIKRKAKSKESRQIQLARKRRSINGWFQ